LLFYLVGDIDLPIVMYNQANGRTKIEKIDDRPFLYEAKDGYHITSNADIEFQDRAKKLPSLILIHEGRIDPEGSNNPKQDIENSIIVVDIIKMAKKQYNVSSMWKRNIKIYIRYGILGMFGLIMLVLALRSMGIIQ